MSLENVGVAKIMRAAWKQHILVPAFNVAYLPMTEVINDTLRELGTFGLIEVARPDVEKFGAKSFAAVAEEFRRVADRRFVRLHLDHVPVIDEDGLRVDWEPLIDQGLELGFDSVMIDGSRLPLEENIAATKTVVEKAHARGVPVEAELGAVLGHEPGPLPPYEELFATGKGFTDPDEAARFVRETGVDWLSVAVGNIHGAISGAAKDQAKPEARLNIEHLRRLNEVCGVPLVLHGGSGIRRESLLKGIQNGIAKINIGTNIRQPYEAHLREHPGDIAGAQQAVAEEIRTLIVDVYGIAGSAERIAEALE